MQDPRDASFAGMPESALSATEVDFCLRVADIPARLDELTRHPLEHDAMSSSESLQPDVSMHAADEPTSQPSPKLPNAASGLTCPECHGSLWELAANGGLRFECRIGDAYGVDALLAHQGEAVEAALWSAVNALQERAAAFRRLAANPRSRITDSGYGQRAEAIERNAQTLLDLLGALIREDEVG